jgi:glycosyltransferase involved in cell wall biosynthesis
MSKYTIIYAIDGLGMGGAERLTASILKNLPDVFSPRVCVFKVRKRGNPMAEQIKALGVPVDFLPIPYVRDLTALPRLVKYLKTVNADLVHGQLELGDIFGNIAAKLARLPSVSTLHTMPSQKMNIKSRLHQEVEFFALRHFCDAIISVSNEARQFYLDISTLPPSKLLTIYNGVDLFHFDNLDRRRISDGIRKELGVPLDSKLLTTVAVLRELKGIQYMIRGLPEIIARFPKVRYLIVGDGVYRETLEREAQLAGVAGHVIFAGQRDNVPHFLAASDIFVLPTLTEALPTVLAEAMAARLPIIASAVGGIPEMIEDGKNGLLVPAGQVDALSAACMRLLSNSDEAGSMGDKGRSVADQKFNIRRQAEQLGELYLDLIRNSKRFKSGSS